ncbi:polysaccharide deacetylase family protein [Halorubrum sp. AD140]|uniref:polysaccharide deacetylase family protein n=1 Tax=Halorubrum sp. AD140 TaxID=3050073 RepID=UPI002ACD0111|nr:polysaccharide deacetylase family protein [Halorubrum sp. AD140]MDZ5810212.1 polysaccharide deacetylase family protein [Halorubrum sp. AD140]
MGSVVLSLDAELGWGHHDLPSPPADRVEAGRNGWRDSLDLLDEYDVPATWAVVGHLFLHDCDGRHNSHPTPEEWFARERRAWSDRRELRFAPNLVAAIADADADHEIGCHTFSHVEFGDPRTTPEIARAELVASLEAAAAASIQPEMTSVVFPRNSVGHRDVIAQCGFTCYRGTSPTAEAFGPSAIRKIGYLVGSTPPLVEPRVDEYGLVDVPASMYLFSFEGPARRAFELAGRDPVVAAARRGIDAAARRDRVFHLWYHPNNLVTDGDVARLRAILEHIDRRRSEGGLRVETMADVARRVTADAGRPAPQSTDALSSQTDAPSSQSKASSASADATSTAADATSTAADATSADDDR